MRSHWRKDKINRLLRSLEKIALGAMRAQAFAHPNSMQSWKLQDYKEKQHGKKEKEKDIFYFDLLS